MWEILFLPAGLVVEKNRVGSAALEIFVFGQYVEQGYASAGGERDIDLRGKGSPLHSE